MAGFPEQIGQYRIERLLGEGGMGAVYLGVHRVLGSRAALKTLRSGSAGGSGIQESISRLQDEGRALAALRHPNVVGVLDFFSEGDAHYLVMEYVEGESLEERLNRAPPDLSEALALALAIGRGVAAAHDKGVLHRDLKPQNVMVTPDGGVRVMDFGLAKFSGATTQTQTGMMVGTPRYMAPEQVRSEPVDGRTDQYAFGILLYRLLCGREPFRDGDSITVCLAHLQEVAPPPSQYNPNVPVEINALVLKCIAKAPGERYPDLHAVLSDLEVLRDHFKTVTASHTRALPARPRPPAPARPAPQRPSPPASRAGGEGWKWMLAAGGLIVALAASIALLRKPAPPAAARPAAASPVAVAPPEPAQTAPTPAALPVLDSAANSPRADCVAQCDREFGACTGDAETRANQCRTDMAANCQKGQESCLADVARLEAEGPESKPYADLRRQQCAQQKSTCAMADGACAMMGQAAQCPMLKAQCMGRC